MNYYVGPMTKLYCAKDGSLLPVPLKRLEKEDQLQAWVAADPGLIGLDLLVLGREISTEFNGRIDILAIDRDGNTSLSNANVIAHHAT